jgi:hypothetical protein
MNVTLKVKDKDLADALKRVMADPMTRTLVLVLGALLELPTDGQRRRAVREVADKLGIEA